MADSTARGRARGRAKPPARSQEGRPPGFVPDNQAASASGRAMHRGSGQLQEGGPALVQRVGQMALGGNGNGGNGNGGPVGRGNMRGKKILTPALRTRPEALLSKKGTSGTHVNLQANYFSLLNKPDWCLRQYRVDFAPEIDLIDERKRLLRVQRNNIGGEYLFDGSVMYTTQQLCVSPETIEVFSARESDGSQVRITIRHVGEVMMGDIHYIQFFNILTRKCLKLLNLQLIRRDYYDPCAKIEIPQYHLEVWPGYRTTIHQYEKDVLLCSEITHKILRTDTCLQLLTDTVRNNPQDYKKEFANTVIGCVVLTDYNNRTYLISDVNWDESPASTFDKNGTKVSYINYYKERYNINIRDKNQPMLVSKIKPREKRAMQQQAVSMAGDDPNIVLLIPEICRLTGLTEKMRRDFNLMRTVASHTRIGPNDRIDRLMAMNRRLNGEERIQQEFRNWNMRLADRLVEVPGRVLQQELIVLGNNVTVQSGQECDWTKHLRSNPMFVMPQGGLEKWVIMYPVSVAQDIPQFVDTLTKAAKGMRFWIAPPEYVELPNERNESYIRNLDQVISNLSPQLIFVVLKKNKADQYAAIKKKSLVDRAVPTQVLLSNNMTKKGVMSIATKVAIQINCKIGGAPWSVQMPLGGLMVVGFDVCHDKTSKGKSCGAMVASLNKPMSRYFSAVSLHTEGEELSNDLGLNIAKAMHSYKKYNNTYPSHIIIYRDGVGDGQIEYVVQHEVVRVQKAVAELTGQNPKLGFVIVSKRINTRLFENHRNPRPGTVVDDVITLPERYDFYIISQFVNQGTVSPTSYNVIHDSLGLDPDKMQRLAYKTTHMYYNWSGTVRVPAPVQYAHKLAFLVSQYLHQRPNASLQELLFFL